MSPLRQISRTFWETSASVGFGSCVAGMPRSCPAGTHGWETHCQELLSVSERYTDRAGAYKRDVRIKRG